MQNLTLPITHILLWDSPDARHLVTAVSAKNGLKRGHQYLMLAVNAKGKVAVAPQATPQELVKGPAGQWHDMDSFEWTMPATQAVVGANDNG